MKKSLQEQAFDALIKNADDWVVDEYYATHKPTNSKWWMHQGMWFFYCNDIKIGLIFRIRLYYWLRDLELKKVINAVNTP